MMQEILEAVRSIDRRLVSLEARVDDRLGEARPIWEQALSEIGKLRASKDQVSTRLDQLAAGQDQLRSEVEQLRAGQDLLRTELRDEMKVGFHKVERQLIVLSRDFLRIRSEMDMLEDRVEKLEPQQT